jgi:hypothetical protein
MGGCSQTPTASRIEIYVCFRIFDVYIIFAYNQYLRTYSILIVRYVYNVNICFPKNIVKGGVQGETPRQGIYIHVIYVYNTIYEYYKTN